MNWHVTWQDPVAIGMVIAIVVFSLWLRRRGTRTSNACQGCASVGSLNAPPPKGSAVQVSLKSTTLGRYAGKQP
ncbi:MAG: hypothetical protein HUU55_13470 [Myxococcales bacterium]|nr:hypothetical protein [Myxococcales bacterium]